MSGDEGFLTRWSRRKRRAAPARGEQPNADDANHPAPREAPPAPPPAVEEMPEADLARLPPIESIGAGTDIRAFLAPGVPAELTRAALRRAWATDPTIRDFVGLSENSWDFTAPNGVPGFGSLSVEEARRLLDAAAGAGTDDTGRLVAQREPGEQVAAATGESKTVAKSGAPEPSFPEQSRDGETQDSETSGKVAAAVQQEPGEIQNGPRLPKRGHGGALPK